MSNINVVLLLSCIFLHCSFVLVAQATYTLIFLCSKVNFPHKIEKYQRPLILKLAMYLYTVNETKQKQNQTKNPKKQTEIKLGKKNAPTQILNYKIIYC